MNKNMKVVKPVEKYKPGYLGKVMPVDNPSKLTDFVTNKYDAFSKIYDVCKDQSNSINDIKSVDAGNDCGSLVVKVSTTNDTMNNIKEATKNDPALSVNNDVITAKT